jgi:hypothetical protein
MKNIFKPAIFTAAALLLITSAAYAEKVTFVKEYTYQASELDSKVTSPQEVK